MKQYLLSVHSTAGDPQPSQEEMQAAYASVDAFNTELKESGAWVFAGGLHPAKSATVVRVQDGKAMMTDGPFAESKEQFGGFWVVQAADLDAALELGRRAAIACREAVEVRPFQED